MAAAVAAFLVGLGGAWSYYRGGGTAARRLASSAGVLYRVLRDRYYIDEIYRATIIRPLYAVAGWLERIVDRLGIDGSLDGLAGGALKGSSIGRAWQSGHARHYAMAFALGAVLLAVLPFLARLVTGGG